MNQYIYKLPAFIFLFVAYILSSTFVLAFMWDTQRKRRILIVNTSRFCRRLLRLLGVSWSVKPRNNAHGGKTRLILANHLSYIDVAVLSAVFPAVFVTSYEVKNSPIEGLLARCAGSVFVDRRSGKTLLNDIRILSSLLKQGFTIVIFPEATSSSGENILPFKSALLNSAFEANVDILPACFNYRAIDGDKITALNRDMVFYYGKMEFLKHFLGLLRLRTVDLELTLLGCLPADIPDRKSAARVAFDCISQNYVAIR